MPKPKKNDNQHAIIDFSFDERVEQLKFWNGDLFMLRHVIWMGFMRATSKKNMNFEKDGVDVFEGRT